MISPAPFAAFAPSIREQSPLRQAITQAYRRPEPDCVAALIGPATLPAQTVEAAGLTARQLVTKLRAHGHGSAVEALVQEYAL